MVDTKMSVKMFNTIYDGLSLEILRNYARMFSIVITAYKGSNNEY